jgi:hypothetical protein
LWKGVGKIVRNPHLKFFLNVVPDAELRLNVRDDRSAMVLSTPAMDTEMSGEASLAWILSAKARVRRPDGSAGRAQFVGPADSWCVIAPGGDMDMLKRDQVLEHQRVD